MELRGTGSSLKGDQAAKPRRWCRPRALDARRPLTSAAAFSTLCAPSTPCSPSPPRSPSSGCSSLDGLRQRLPLQKPPRRSRLPAPAAHRARASAPPPDVRQLARARDDDRGRREARLPSQPLPHRGRGVARLLHGREPVARAGRVWRGLDAVAGCSAGGVGGGAEELTRTLRARLGDAAHYAEDRAEDDK